MTEIFVFLVAVAVFAVVGIWIGMLIAPRLERLTEPRDEEPGDGDDPADD